MREINICFTGIGRRIELVQAFRLAADCQNIKLKIYGADYTSTAPALVYCDFVRKVCSMKAEGYIDELLEICQSDKIDLLIPTIDTDLLLLAKNKERFEQIGTRVLISDYDKIQICRDKNCTGGFFEQCGLKAPKAVSDYREYQFSFPAFIKPKDGSSSINAFKVDSLEQLEAIARRMNDYIVQPFIEGTEYTIDIFCDFNGEPISIVPRQRLAVRSGEVLKTKIDCKPDIISQAKQICARFKPVGPITVQLIKQKQTGDNYYIEINPRFGGGAPLSMKAGASGAEYVLKLLLQEPLSYREEVEDGAVYSRFDQSVCVAHGERRARGVVFDLDDTLFMEKDYISGGFEAVASHLGNAEYEQQLWKYFYEKKPAIDTMLDNLGRESEKEKVLAVYREHLPHLQLEPKIKELLQILKSRQIKIGIITDGRPDGQRKKIEALGLQALVDDIIITDELGGEQFRKPCDIAFRIMQKRWELPFEEMVYVGDNLQKDFMAPQQLGIRGVYYENKNGIYYCKNAAQTGALKRITNLDEILSLI